MLPVRFLAALGRLAVRLLPIPNGAEVAIIAAVLAVGVTGPVAAAVGL